VDSVSFFENSISENREIVPRRRWLPKPSSKYWRYSFWNIFIKTRSLRIDKEGT